MGDSTVSWRDNDYINGCGKRENRFAPSNGDRISSDLWIEMIQNGNKEHSLVKSYIEKSRFYWYDEVFWK